MTKSLNTIVALAAAVLAPVAAVTAQRTSPAGLSSVEGNGQSDMPWSSSQAMYQQIDTSNRGTPFLIRGLRVRREGDPSFVHAAPARTLRIQVQMGLGNVSSAGTTFASNFIGSPTTVFNATVNLPVWSGRSATRPAAFDVSVPFTVPFTYQANLNDLIVQLKVLSNSATGLTVSDFHDFGYRRGPFGGIGPGCIPPDPRMFSTLDNSGAATGPWTIDLWNCSPGQIQGLIVGLAPIGPVPIPCPQPPLGSLYPRLDVVLFLGLANALGQVHVTVPVPVFPTINFRMQAFGVYQGTVVVSNYGNLVAPSAPGPIQTRMFFAPSSSATSATMSRTGGVVFDLL